MIEQHNQSSRYTSRIEKEDQSDADCSIFQVKEAMEEEEETSQSPCLDDEEIRESPEESKSESPSKADDSCFISQDGGKSFKLTKTKGAMVYDQRTKQKRFVSPMEQFLAEQNCMFEKKGT